MVDTVDLESIRVISGVGSNPTGRSGMGGVELEILNGMVLFVVGIFGSFVIRKNLVIVLMSLELMLLGVSLNFIIYSVYLDDVVGQVVALFILVVAASESAIGLSMIVVYYRLRGVINISVINMLKG
jgi:NADH-quinone oxidoreductase subunit K